MSVFSYCLMRRNILCDSVTLQGQREGGEKVAAKMS